MHAVSYSVDICTAMLEKRGTPWLLLLLLLLCHLCLHKGNAQITCYTEPSVAGEFNCESTTNNFQAATIEECCVERNGYFYKEGTGECQACIVFGFFNGSEITLPEQSEATTLAIGFIKGGNVQPLTGIDSENTANFGITSGGSATEADFTISPVLFEIKGSDAREPFRLIIVIRMDGVALETAEDFTLTLEGRNTAGRAILNATVPGHFVFLAIRVVIEDAEIATLQFTESNYSSREGELFIVPAVRLLTIIATNLTVQIVPLNISEVISRNLLPALPAIPVFNPKAPNIATSVVDYSTEPVEITFLAGGASIITLDPGIAIVDDTIHEVEQVFALFLEVVDAIDPDRVDIQRGRNASLAIIFDDDPMNIGFEQERYTVFEANATGDFTFIPIIKENDQESELTFEVTVTLILESNPTAAVEGEDFFAEPHVQNIRFKSNMQEVDYVFEVLDDYPGVPELTETFQIQLSLEDEGPANVNLGASGGSLFATVTIVIIDDDVIIGWEQTVTSVNESQILLELCVHVQNDTEELPEELNVSLAANTIRGTAADPGDYTALQANSDIFIDIIDNGTRQTCIEVEIIDDDLLEEVEFLSLRVVPDQSVTSIQLDPDVTFVYILDNDFVRIGFNETVYTVLESDRVASVFVAVLEGDLQRRVSVTFSTNANTTTVGDELPKDLLFDESTTEIQVNITIKDDDIFEELLETFTVSLVRDPVDPIDEVVVDPDAATVFIRDAAVINFSNPVYSVGEAETNVTVQLLLRFDKGFNLSSQSIEVEFMTVNVTAQGGRDYEEVFTNITIISTMTSISIQVINDQAVEANEMFRCRITLISPSPNVVITQTEAVVVIVDDDGVHIQFKEPEYSVMEGRQLSLGVQIMGENEIPLTVPFTIRGSATLHEDFNLTSGKNQCITIDPNIAIDTITTRRQLLNLSIIDDDIALEGSESILLELSDDEPQVRLGEQSSTTVLITDVDEIIVCLVDVSCGGSENENINVTVSRSGARIASNLTLNITVELLSEMNVTGPQPSDDMDFTNLEIAVMFDPNDKIEDTLSFNLPIVDDDINEPEEIFFLSLKREANPIPGIALLSHMLVCTLQDDDEISIHFGKENYTFQESAGPHLISLVATRSSQQAFLVVIETEGETFLTLNITNPELISFRPELGNNNSMSINIGITNDNAKGKDRSQVLRLKRQEESPPFVNCVEFLQTCSSTTIHITDDDRVIIGFEDTSRRVLLESVGEIQLCVSVTPNTIGNDFEAFFLQVETSDHSAKPGRDYIIDPPNDCVNNSQDSGSTNSFLLGYFNHTRQRCCLNLSIVDDDEEEEMVIELDVTLSQAGASSLLPIDINPDMITVVIVDDDQCAIETTELEGASVCYTQYSNCSGSCIILNTTDECCSENGISTSLLGSNICEECEPTLPPSSSTDQSTVIIASVVASVCLILIIVIIVVAVVVVCLRRVPKTVILSRKGSEVDTMTTARYNVRKGSEVDTMTTARYNAYEGTLSVVTAELIQTLPRSLIVSASQLNLRDMLGQGEFGIVYKAFYKRYINSETEVVAVKTLKGLFTGKDVRGLAEEVLKMQAFHHLHVMSLIGVCLDSGAGPAIVMPYMENGSLLDYLRKDRNSLLLAGDASPNKVSETQKFLLDVCLQIAEGMEYLAQEKVVHRDLSARNCMIDADGIIKVADFGLSVDIYTTNYYRQGKEQEIKLPIRWMAVESIMDGIYTEKSDVWSFGVTVWEVYNGGRLPYPGVASPALIRHVESGVRLSKPENAACSDEVYSCMQQCWLEAADERPHFHDLVTTISNNLESIAGYLGLQRSLSLVQRVKQDFPRSPRPKRRISELALLEEEEKEEQLEGKKGAEKGVKEGENEASTEAISSQVMESAC